MPQLRDGVVLEDVNEDEAIMIDLNTGRYISLNRTATMLLRTWVDSGGIPGALEALGGKFDVEQSVIEADLTKLLTSLSELELIDIDGDPVSKES